MVKKYSQPENTGKKSKATPSPETLNFLLNFSKSLESKKLRKKIILLNQN